MALRIYNEKVYQEYMKLDYTKLSCPLLVSTKKDYLENLYEPIDDLIHLYEELNPKLTIFACGNREEYYSVVQEFIKRTKDYNIDRISKQNEIIGIEDILYTYHPNNLRFSKNQKQIKEKIKSLV